MKIPRFLAPLALALLAGITFGVTLKKFQYFPYALVKTAGVSIGASIKAHVARDIGFFSARPFSLFVEGRDRAPGV